MKLKRGLVEKGPGNLYLNFKHNLLLTVRAVYSEEIFFLIVNQSKKNSLHGPRSCSDDELISGIEFLKSSYCFV